MSDQEQKAPTTLSAALVIAADDLERLVVEGPHQADMGSWLEEDLDNPGVCYMCLAGAVMYGTLGLPAGSVNLPSGSVVASRSAGDDWMEEDVQRHGKDWSGVLDALDYWRKGCLGSALIRFDPALGVYPRHDERESIVREYRKEIDETAYWHRLDTEEVRDDLIPHARKAAAWLNERGL